MSNQEIKDLISSAQKVMVYVKHFDFQIECTRGDALVALDHRGIEVTKRHCYGMRSPKYDLIVTALRKNL